MQLQLELAVLGQVVQLLLEVMVEIQYLALLLQMAAVVVQVEILFLLELGEVVVEVLGHQQAMALLGILPLQIQAKGIMGATDLLEAPAVEVAAVAEGLVKLGHLPLGLPQERAETDLHQHFLEYL